MSNFLLLFSTVSFLLVANFSPESELNNNASSTYSFVEFPQDHPLLSAHFYHPKTQSLTGEIEIIEKNSLGVPYRKIIYRNGSKIQEILFGKNQDILMDYHALGYIETHLLPHNPDRQETIKNTTEYWKLKEGRI